MADTFTLDGTLANLGLVGPVRITGAYVHTNLPHGQAIVDSTTGLTHLGDARVTVNSTAGTWSVELIDTDAVDLNVEAGELRYELVVHYLNVGTREDGIFTSGWFEMIADAEFDDVALNTSTTLARTFGEVLEERVDALEADSGVGDALTALTARVDGVQDHGDVDGDLLLDPANGYHVFDATGPTEVSLGDPPGYSVAFKAITGADDVTVDGLDDLELTDDQWATFVYYRDAWHLASTGASGGGTVEPVLDPPTSPGTVTVTATDDGYVLTVVAPTVYAGVEWQIDGGTYAASDVGHPLRKTYTGLSAGSEHSGAVRSYNSLGQRHDTPVEWGPENVNSVDLDTQLLAHDPQTFLRFIDGTFEDLGADAATSTWYISGGGVWDGSFTEGPSLAPGDESSADFTGFSLQRLVGGGVGADYDDLTSLTVVAHIQQNGGGSSNLFAAHSVATAGFSTSDLNGVVSTGATPHVIMWVWREDDTATCYLDGVESAAGTAAIGALTTGDIGIYGVTVHGTVFTTDGAIYLARLATFPNVELTEADAEAFAVAADTLGNPR